MEPKTVEHYRWLLENYVFPRLGERAVKDITEEDVKNLVEEKRAQGLSENTVYVLPKLIARVLSFASAEGVCEAPEWAGAVGRGRPKKERETVILTEAQERRLVAWLTENPAPKHLGLYLILTTGMSVQEVLVLTWADVSFPKSRIRVLMERETTPDTRNKYREVAVNERQKIYLKKMASLPAVYVASGKPKPATMLSLRDRLIVASTETGLPSVTCSDLRRTFAVHSLENGMGYAQLAGQMGQVNGRNFRALYRDLVNADTRARLDSELEASRKVRQAPKSIRPAEKNPEVRELESKIEARKRELRETLDCLDADLAIFRTLHDIRGVQGKAREGVYDLVEKLLGDDPDGQMLVEYLRCNMRVADMPSRRDVTVQTIRSRIARGLAKFGARVDEILAKV